MITQTTLKLGPKKVFLTHPNLHNDISYFKVLLRLSVTNENSKCDFNETAMARRKYGCAGATETGAMAWIRGLLRQPTGNQYLLYNIFSREFSRQNN